MTTHPKQRDFLNLNEATRAVHSRASLMDLPPVISPEQAAEDAAYFHEKWGGTGDGTATWQEQAMAYRDAGWSDRAICEELGKSHHTLTRHCGPNPNANSGRMPNEIREQKIKQALELRGRVTQREIAEIVGVREQTVSGWFRVRPLQEAA